MPDEEFLLTVLNSTPVVGGVPSECLANTARINADRRFHAVRGHLLEMADDLRPPTSRTEPQR